ncbi:hypothetical protein MMC10_002129 [Thelotrema lepadinum]|nr:hypothetical protein [Thelotrema lepadinum]
MRTYVFALLTMLQANKDRRRDQTQQEAAGLTTSPFQTLDIKGKTAITAVDRKPKTPASSSQAPVRTRKQRDSLNTHDDKENVGGAPKRKTANAKTTKTAAAPKKQLSEKQQGKQREVSESMEPEEIVPPKPAKGKKRARQDTTSDENSTGDAKPQAKKSRLMQATTAEAKAAASKKFPRTEEEELQALSENLARQYKRYVKVGSDPARIADYNEMMANAIWESSNENMSDKRKNRAIRYYKLAFKHADNGDIVVATRPHPPNVRISFIDIWSGANYINPRLDAMQSKREEDQERLLQERLIQEKKAQELTFQTFDSINVNGVTNIEPQGEHPSNLAPTAEATPSASLAHVYQFNGVQDVSTAHEVHDSNQVLTANQIPTATHQAPTADQVPPVTPHRRSRFSDFVKSVSRPFTTFVPSFSRGTAPAQPQVASAAAVDPTARSLSDTTGSQRTSTQVQQNDGENPGLLAPIQSFPPNGAENASSESPSTLDEMDNLENLQVTPIGLRTIEINTPQLSPIKGNRIDRNQASNMIATVLQSRDNANGIPSALIDPDWLAEEWNKQLEKTERFLYRRYESKVKKQTQDIRIEGKAKLLDYKAKLEKEIEHKYAAHAEERIRAAILQDKAQMAQLKSNPPAKKKKTKKVRHARIGSEQLPMGSDGKIPGPKKGGYGIDDEYLYAPYSDEDSVWSEECSEDESPTPLKRKQMLDNDSPTKNKGKQPVDRTELPKTDPPAKRRRVSFAPPAMKTKLEQAVQVPATPRSGILKKTSKYGPTVEDEEPELSRPLDVFVDMYSDYGAPPGPTMVFKVPSPSSSDFDSEDDYPDSNPVTQPAVEPAVEPTAVEPATAEPTTVEPAIAGPSTVEPPKGLRFAEAEKDTEALRRMKEKADFVRDEKFRPRTPSKLREEKRVSTSPKVTSVADVMAMFPDDDGEHLSLSRFVAV